MHGREYWLFACMLHVIELSFDMVVHMVNCRSLRLTYYWIVARCVWHVIGLSLVAFGMYVIELSLVAFGMLLNCLSLRLACY